MLSFCVSSAYAEEPVVLLNPHGDDQNPVYVQVIVTACPVVEKALEPRGQGEIPADNKSISHDERIAWYRSIGCVECSDSYGMADARDNLRGVCPTWRVAGRRWSFWIGGKN